MYLLTTPNVQWLPVVLLFIYLILFNLSFGTIPYIFNSSIYSPDAVDLASGIGVMALWSISFIIVYPYFIMQYALGRDGIIWFFSAFMAIAFFFCLFLVPEIKGKTNEQTVNALNEKTIHFGFQ